MPTGLHSTKSLVRIYPPFSKDVFQDFLIHTCHQITFRLWHNMPSFRRLINGHSHSHSPQCRFLSVARILKLIYFPFLELSWLVSTLFTGSVWHLSSLLFRISLPFHVLGSAFSVIPVRINDVHCVHRVSLLVLFPVVWDTCVSHYLTIALYIHGCILVHFGNAWQPPCCISFSLPHPFNIFASISTFCRSVLLSSSLHLS